MKLPYAILLTIGILIAMIFLPDVLRFLIIIGIAVWATIDAQSIELNKYHSAFVPTDLGWFFLCILLFWGLVLPWYLHMRYRIKKGLATLKKKY